MNIKYRAWDRERKRMRGVMDIKWLNNGNMRINATEDENNYEPLMYMKDYQGEELREFILMEYTGIKDKNGKEIYEKDFVKVKKTMYTDCSRKEIEKVEEEIALMEKYENLGFALKTYKGWQFLFWGIGSDWQYEVIGNFYENEHLILSI